MSVIPSTFCRVVPLPDLAATGRLALELARGIEPGLRAGDVVALAGPLGVGKTAFAAAFLRTLDVHGEIPSPTFTIVQSYETVYGIAHHFDLYRIKREEELDEIGWDEMLAEGFALVEWPERAGQRLPEECLTLRFSLEKQQRACVVEASGDWAARIGRCMERLEPTCEDKVEVAGRSLGVVKGRAMRRGVALRCSAVAGGSSSHARLFAMAGRLDYMDSVASGHPVEREADVFLSLAGWGGALREPICADFSSRRFMRLRRNDRADVATAILMEAGQDQGTVAFVRVARLLRRLGLSAPKIYAEDAARGLVLMEDFGDRNIGTMIDAGVSALPLLLRAAEVLARLHLAFSERGMDAADGLPRFDVARFVAQAELYLDEWISFAEGRNVTAEEREAFRSAWAQTLRKAEAVPNSFLLRDFMPDNLMDLSGLDGVQSVGLLDFQDAGVGPIAYDLASLCEVVRRDADCGWAHFDAVTAHYYALARPDCSLDALREAGRVLSAQRHLRVLGILARFARKGEPQKLASCAERIKAHLAALHVPYDSF